MTPSPVRNDEAGLTLAHETEILNRFPEVRWDRTAGDVENRTVFGWVDRPGSVRSDFLVLIFTPPDLIAMVTSSAALSLDFHRRLYGDEEGHNACRPVEDHYGELVPHTVRRRNLDPSILGQ